MPDAFLDCHLMVSNPKQWVPDFAKAGASLYSFHLECVVSVNLNLDLLSLQSIRIDQQQHEQTDEIEEEEEDRDTLTFFS